jgi:hypothetical protein
MLSKPRHGGSLPYFTSAASGDEEDPDLNSITVLANEALRMPSAPSQLRSSTSMQHVQSLHSRRPVQSSTSLFYQWWSRSLSSKASAKPRRWVSTFQSLLTTMTACQTPRFSFLQIPTTRTTLTATTRSTSPPQSRRRGCSGQRARLPRVPPGPSPQSAWRT